MKNIRGTSIQSLVKKTRLILPAVLFSLTACQQVTEKDYEPATITSNVLLDYQAAGDSYAYQVDSEFCDGSDSQTYRVLDRLVTMFEKVRNAEDVRQWADAVSRCIYKYCDYYMFMASVQATQEETIENMYAMVNQEFQQAATACESEYIKYLIELYRMTNYYGHVIEASANQPERASLYGQEFREWYGIICRCKQLLFLAKETGDESVSIYEEAHVKQVLRGLVVQRKDILIFEETLARDLLEENHYAYEAYQSPDYLTPDKHQWSKAAVGIPENERDLITKLEQQVLDWLEIRHDIAGRYDRKYAQCLYTETMSMVGAVHELLTEELQLLEPEQAIAP